MSTEKPMSFPDKAVAIQQAMVEGQEEVTIDGHTFPITRTERAHVRQCEVGHQTFVEQNPQKSSRFGIAARAGHKILWIFEGGNYMRTAKGDTPGVVDGKFVRSMLGFKF